MSEALELVERMVEALNNHVIEGQEESGRRTKNGCARYRSMSSLPRRYREQGLS